MRSLGDPRFANSKQAEIDGFFSRTLIIIIIIYLMIINSGITNSNMKLYIK